MTFAALHQDSRANKEAWRYTSLAPYAQMTFDEAPEGIALSLPPPIAPQRLVYVNGRYCPEVSQTELLPQNAFRLTEKGSAKIDVAAQTCLALQPLEILYVNMSAPAPWQGSTEIEVTLGANSRLTLIERYLNKGEGHFLHLPQMKLVLAEQSKLVHGRLVGGARNSLHFSKTSVTISSGAFYDHFALVINGGLTRCETNVSLCGELAGAHLAGAALLRDSARANFLARVAHEAPYGTSRQLFKAVLDDKAQAAFQGKIYVAKAAQKTDGHQLSRALLLSDKAEMNAKPELEVYADDVKCGHGSAIGNLNEQELFYLRARGIPEAKARAMLIDAFIKEELDHIQSAELAAAAREMVDTWLKQK